VVAPGTIHTQHDVRSHHARRRFLGISEGSKKDK